MRAFQLWSRRLADYIVGRVNPPPVPEVDPLTASDLVGAGAFLLDVREPDEWQAGRAPDAVHIALGELVERVDEVPDDRRVVAICRSGARSAQATAWLNSNGHDTVNLAGGMRAW